MTENRIYRVGSVIYDAIKNLKLTGELSDGTIRVIDIGGRVYPIVARQGTVSPYCTYRRTTASIDYTKCGSYEASVSYEIDIISGSYDESITLVSYISDRLLRLKGKTVNDIKIKDIKITSSSEDFNEDEFIQTINIDIIIN